MSSYLSYKYVVAFLVVTLISIASECFALQVGIVTNGQSSAIFAVTQELLLRGHHVRVVVPGSEWNNCRSRAGPLSCSAIPNVHPSHFVDHTDGSAHGSLSTAISGALSKGGFKPSVFLTEVPLRRTVDTFLAADSGIPTVFLVNNAESFHRLGTTSSRGFLHNAFEERGANDFKDIFRKHHVLIPFPFGVNFPDEYRCPNVHLVGFLPERLAQHRDLPATVNQWVDACRNGIIYVELRADDGDVKLYEHTVIALDQLSSRRNICIAWSSLQVEPLRGVKITSPLFLPVREEVDREVLLARNHTRLFVTSSCDLQTLEKAAQSETVLTVLRNSQKRSAVCDFFNTTSTCIVVDVATEHSRLYDVLNDLWSNAVVASEMRRNFRYNHLLGGSSRAAQTIELAAFLGRDNTDFFCATESNWVRKHDLDVAVVTAGVIGCLCFFAVQVLYPRVRRLLGEHTHQ